METGGSPATSLSDFCLGSVRMLHRSVSSPRHFPNFLWFHPGYCSIIGHHSLYGTRVARRACFALKTVSVPQTMQEGSDLAPASVGLNLGTASARYCTVCALTFGRLGCVASSTAGGAGFYRAPDCCHWSPRVLRNPPRLEECHKPGRCSPDDSGAAAAYRHAGSPTRS
jgi:hypothetical protein